MLAKREESALFSPPVRPESDEWVNFTDYIGKLLNCRPHYHHTSLAQVRHALHQPPPTVVAELVAPPAGDDAHEEIAPPGSSPLILVNNPRPAWRPSVLSRLAAPGPLDRHPGSILFVRRPRWPLRRLLFIIRDHEHDPAALSWVERLAAPGWTRVTLLPLTPLAPWLQRESMLPPAWEVLVDAGAAGSALHRCAEHLRGLGIRGTICWRPGASLSVVRREVREAGHDLIVTGAEPSGGRRSLGGFVGSLLRWADRPVLVAR